MKPEERPAPKQERAFATRAAITKGAARAIVKHGYAGATLSEISKESKVTNGAFYFHFPTRDAVALAVIGEQQEIVSNLIEANLEPSRPALDNLLVLSAAFVPLLQRDPIVRAGILLITERSEINRPVNRPYRAWVERVEGFLRDAIEDGDIRADLDTEDVARFIVSVLNGTRILAEALSAGRDLGESLHNAWAYLLPGVMVADRIPAIGERLDAAFARAVPRRR